MGPGLFIKKKFYLFLYSQILHTLIPAFNLLFLYCLIIVIFIYRKKDYYWYDKWKQKSFTLATWVNAAKAGEPKKSNDDRNNNGNQNYLNKTARDFSQFNYYNC